MPERRLWRGSESGRGEVRRNGRAEGRNSGMKSAIGNDELRGGEGS